MCPWSPENVIRPPGAGVKGETPDRKAGNQIQILSKCCKHPYAAEPSLQSHDKISKFSLC